MGRTKKAAEPRCPVAIVKSSTTWRKTTVRSCAGCVTVCIPNMHRTFCGVVCVVTCPFDNSVGVGAFVIGLGQISSFLSFNTKNKTNHPISSNSHPSATANKAIHCLKWGVGGLKIMVADLYQLVIKNFAPLFELLKNNNKRSFGVVVKFDLCLRNYRFYMYLSTVLIKHIDI